MSNYPSYRKEDLGLYLNNEEYVRKTIHQIKKNLSQFGYDFSPKINEENILDSLIESLEPIVKDFLEHHQEQFMAYLYQVDLKESELNINEYGSDYIVNICYKIVRREAQKIYFQFLMANKKI